MLPMPNAQKDKVTPMGLRNRVALKNCTSNE